MKSEHRTVDLNAYIENVNCEIKNVEDGKQLIFSFSNVSQEIITAIKLKCLCFDSFDDRIEFGNEDFLEVKKADINVKPAKTAGFAVDIKQCDLQRTEVEVLQIVYINGERVAPMEEHIIEYDIGVLSSSGSANDHTESDMLSYMKEKNDKAICFPQEHSAGWICSCGRLNKNSSLQCVSCGYGKYNNFEDFNEENIEQKLSERFLQEKADEERKRAELKAEAKRAEKKKRVITISVASAVALVVISVILSIVIHNIKYGLSDEEKAQHLIAQNNYQKIESFIDTLYVEYSDLSEERYHDDNYDYEHHRENRLSDAEKDADYLFSRGIYLASIRLYDTIRKQYPEKYHQVYDQLVSLNEGHRYTDYLVAETMYVKNQSSSEIREREGDMDRAIQILENYMANKTLNPSKIEGPDVYITQPMYSKVYGINLGVLFYNDGSIQYIGEVKNGKASGYGMAWYPPENDNGTCCKGQFVRGQFKSGDSYDIDGNKMSASELKDISFSGEFVMVHRADNSRSSEQIAQRNQNNEDISLSKACAAVETYLTEVRKKQPSITNITWIDIPDVIGDYYYFYCTVEEAGLTRDGTITVEKGSNGTFKATGIRFEE